MFPHSFQPHNPDCFITSVTSYSFNPEASCPKFLAFMRFLTCSDDQVILTIQMFLGSVLLGNVRHERFLWLCGDGDNGKSVFADVITSVFGSAAVSSLSMDQLAGRHEVAGLLDKKLNIANEFSRLTPRHESVIKRYTSNELIAVDEKYQRLINIRLNIRLLMMSNSVPHVDDKSDGFWRRGLLVFCYAKVAPWQKVQGYAEYLFQSEGPGIFNWILQGAVELQRRNGKICVAPAIEEAVRSQRQMMDPHTEFLKQELVATDHDKWLPGVRVLYEGYVAWMRERGHRGALSWPHFRALLTKVYPHAVAVRKRHPAYGRQYGYTGVFWKNSVEQQEDYDQRVAERRAAEAVGESNDDNGVEQAFRDEGIE